MVPWIGTNLLPKFPGYFWASAKFPGYFRDFANFRGCFQDCEVGVGDFIPKPGFLYLFRSRNTFSNWKKEKSGMGNVQNFPITTMGVLPDQEWKIPRKSWNSITIFYSVGTVFFSSQKNRSGSGRDSQRTLSPLNKPEQNRHLYEI